MVISQESSESCVSSEMESTPPLFVAKYDYKSRTNTDMSFKKGDQLFITDDDNKDWWFAKAKHSDQKGFVPSSYVAKFESLDAEE